MAKKKNLENKVTDTILSSIEKSVNGIYSVINDVTLTITHFIERIGDQYKGYGSGYDCSKY